MITVWLEFLISNALATTALAVLAAVVTWHMRPRWAFAVWLVVLIKLLVPPLWEVPLVSLRPLFADGQETSENANLPHAHESSIFPAAGDPPLVAFDDSVELRADGHSYLPGPIDPLPAASSDVGTLDCLVLPAFGLWTAGALLWAAVAFVRIRRFSLLLAKARRAPRYVQTEVDSLANRLGVRRVPVVKLVRRRMPPLVWCLFGHPTILIPAGLLRDLTPGQRTALLMHELVHLRRRDHRVRLVELASLALYWWLPAAWWVRRKVEQTAEQCCDAEVVAHLPALSRAYAEALLTTIDFLSAKPSPLPLGASGFSQFGLVSRRIEMILQPSPAARYGWRGAWPLRLLVWPCFPCRCRRCGPNRRRKHNRRLLLTPTRRPKPTRPALLPMLWIATHLIRSDLTSPSI